MDGIAQRPLEVELKYRMSGVAAGERLLVADELAGLWALGPATDVLQEDRYLDTPDAALAAAGYAGRLRSTEDGTIISLKGLRRQDDGGATHRRAELEGPADPSAPPVAWPASEARDVVVGIAGDRVLEELVVLRQLRRKRLYGRDGTVVELSLDDVEVVSGGRVVERFAELEAEVREGDEAVLGPLAELLAEIEELVPAGSSKLDRAMEAVRRERAAEADGSAAYDEAAAETVELDAVDEAAAVTEADADVVAFSAPGAAALEAGVEVVPEPSIEEELAVGLDAVDDDVEVDDEPADEDVEGDPFAPRPEDDLALQAALEASAQAATATGVPTALPADEVREPHADPTPVPVAAPAAKAEPRLTAGKTPGVLTDDHLAEAGRKVLRFHLARMVAREAGTREGRDNEELHGMRVATRRQRAAWRVFGVAFDQKRTGRHQRRLKEVARDLGAVRDLDVLIEAGEGYQKTLAAADRPAFEPLLAKWRGQRDAARVVLINELDSDRHQRWVDEYIAFVQAEGIGTRSVGPVEPHRVRDTMPSRIWAAYEGVRAYEPVMRWADVTTLHDLRIAAKWLRYTLEFVREALGPESAPVIERVVALQDHLGWLHDADVAAGLARAFLVEHAGDLSEPESAAIGRYLVDRERELARLRRTVGPAWRGVSSLGFRRALGRLVAGL
jgi:CHAD domain-containing protein